MRGLAKLKRFVREFKGLQSRTNKTTNLEERKGAEIFIIKLVQEDAFAEEIQKLKLQEEHTMNKCNKLHQLNAFLDKKQCPQSGRMAIPISLSP